MFRYGEPTFSDGLHGMSSCVGTGSGHRYAGLLTVRAAWGLGDVPILLHRAAGEAVGRQDVS